MNIEYIPTYDYFSNFCNLQNKSILDFGCNNGNLLRSSKGKIREENYIGIDVDREALLAGKLAYPNAKWIAYNRFNPVYNPLGVISELPVINEPVNLMISYSVFTHMTIDDTEEIIDHLMAGVYEKVLFTYCNVENRKCVEWFRNRRVNCDEIPIQDEVYLADNKIVNGYPLVATHFVSFYRPEFIMNKFLRYNPKVFSPPEGWLQDCIELSIAS